MPANYSGHPPKVDGLHQVTQRSAPIKSHYKLDVVSQIGATFIIKARVQGTRHKT